MRMHLLSWPMSLSSQLLGAEPRHRNTQARSGPVLKPRYVDLQDNRIEVPASPTPWEEVTGNASPVVQVQEGLVYFNCEPLEIATAWVCRLSKKQAGTWIRKKESGSGIVLPEQQRQAGTCPLFTSETESVSFTPRLKGVPCACGLPGPRGCTFFPSI